MMGVASGISCGVSPLLPEIISLLLLAGIMATGSRGSGTFVVPLLDASASPIE